MGVGTQKVCSDYSVSLNGLGAAIGYSAGSTITFRHQLAAQVLVALIGHYGVKPGTRQPPTATTTADKDFLCDLAISYADRMIAKLDA